MKARQLISRWDDHGPVPQYIHSEVSQAVVDGCEGVRQQNAKARRLLAAAVVEGLTLEQELRSTIAELERKVEKLEEDLRDTKEEYKEEISQLEGERDGWRDECRSLSEEVDLLREQLKQGRL